MDAKTLLQDQEELNQRKKAFIKTCWIEIDKALGHNVTWKDDIGNNSIPEIFIGRDQDLNNLELLLRITARLSPQDKTIIMGKIQAIREIQIYPTIGGYKANFSFNYNGKKFSGELVNLFDYLLS